MVLRITENYTKQGMKIENSELSSRLTELEKEVVDKNDRITLLQVQLESTTSAFQSKDAFNSQGYFCATLPPVNERRDRATAPSAKREHQSIIT